MSLTYDTINSICRELEVNAADNVINNTPLVKYLRQSKIGQLEGEYIWTRPRYAVPDLTMWNGTDALSSNSDTEIMTKAKYPWAHGYMSETITRNNWLAAANKGERAVAALAKEMMIAMEDGLRDDLETELFTEYDGSSHTFMSIPDIVNKADPTNLSGGLGGIDVVTDTTNAWWQANTLAYNSSNGGLRLHIQRMMRTCSKVGSKPDLIITTEDIVNQYEDEIYTKLGILSEKVKSWGFTDLIPFQGVPVYYSDDCTSETMYFLNSKYLNLIVHPDDWLKRSDWKETSTTNLNLISNTTFTAQLITSCRISMGYITGIS